MSEYEDDAADWVEWMSGYNYADGDGPPPARMDPRIKVFAVPPYRPGDDDDADDADDEGEEGEA